jgi:hypothetical protein
MPFDRPLPHSHVRLSRPQRRASTCLAARVPRLTPRVAAFKLKGFITLHTHFFPCSIFPTLILFLVAPLLALLPAFDSV